MGGDPARHAGRRCDRHVVGLRQTLVIGAIGGGLSFLWILFSPQRHLREMPEPIEDEPVTEELGAALPGVADPLAPEHAT